ncbi:MAG TPA: response regulator transcription factor [Blastocatellia bacterium]
MSNSVTVVIVDDHFVVREGVRALFETQPDISIVGEAASGVEAVRLCADYAPDVVLMDLLMPGLNGVEATRQIKQVSPRSQVIVLTSYHEDEHILPAIRAGALSYLLKEAGPDELLAAVRKAAQGETTIHPRVAAKMMRTLQGAEAKEENPFDDLSKRELEVLRLVAEGLSNAAIGEALFISEKTVKSHVGNILSKLHLTDRTQAAVYAWLRRLVE